MYKLFLFLVTGLCFFFSTGCKTGKTSAGISREQSLNDHWVLKTIDGNNIPKTVEEPYLSFDTETHSITGSTGCNRLNTGYETEGNKIKIAMGITTRRACIGENIEREFLTNIKEADSFEIKENTLILYNSEKKELLTFARKTEN